MFKKAIFPLVFVTFSAFGIAEIDSARMAPLKNAIANTKLTEAEELLASINPTEEEKQFLLGIAEKAVVQRNNQLKRAERFVPNSGVYQAVMVTSTAIVGNVARQILKLSFWKQVGAGAATGGLTALVLEIPTFYADYRKSYLADAMKIQNLFIPASCGTITLDLRNDEPKIEWTSSTAVHQESGDDNRPSAVS
jgi:hypothetical protein